MTLNIYFKNKKFPMFEVETTDEHNAISDIYEQLNNQSKWIKVNDVVIFEKDKFDYATVVAK